MGGGNFDLSLASGIPPLSPSQPANVLILLSAFQEAPPSGFILCVTSFPRAQPISQEGGADVKTPGRSGAWRGGPDSPYTPLVHRPTSLAKLQKVTSNASSCGLGPGQGGQAWQFITMGGRAVSLHLPSSFRPRLLPYQLLLSGARLSSG